MASLQFPTSSSPGAIPGEGNGRLINALALKDGADTRWFSVPGLDAVAATGVATPRGGVLVNDALLLARANSLYALNAGYQLAPIDVLPGTQPVTMVRDNYAAPAGDAQAIATGGPHVVAVTESGTFIVTAAGVRPYPISSGGFQIGTPNSVCFLDGYFVFSYADGTIRATGTNTAGQTSNTLQFNDQSFTRAESSPDGLLRVTASGGQVWAWGETSTEVYDDQGLSPFPFSRSQVIPVGLYGTWCVAGWEPGWDGPQIFVAADQTVRMMSGYTAQRISTRPVERAIAAATGPGVLRASVYTFGGNAIWSLSGPGFTWEFNATTQQWHERRSQGMSRWRAETSVRAFGRWFFGDLATGGVMALNPDSRTEGGAPVVARIESAPLRNFPDRFRLGGLTLDITTGQGAPTAADASCLIDWTVNGGGSWAQPLTRPIGGVGRYGIPVRVGDLGRSGRDGVQVGITVSDPVAFSLRGAELPSIQARKGS
jgi:hypothetical protein